jgi:DNA anti-recombination protein RmuC
MSIVAGAMLAVAGARSNKLKNESVDKIVEVIKKNLKTLEAQLRDDITGDLAKMKNEDVRRVQSEIGTLRSSIQQLAVDLSKTSEGLKNSQPQLQRIVQLEQEANKYEAAVRKIQRVHTSALDAWGNAAVLIPSGCGETFQKKSSHS